MAEVTIAIVGAGSRGTGYGEVIAGQPDRARVVAVAEPRDVHRQRCAAQHGIAPENVVVDWEELAKKPKLADAVIIATSDALHAGPAIAFARKGYHILLEKPMAPTEGESREICTAALENGILLAVSHVMRYTPYTRRVKEIVDSGLLGDIVNIQVLEPVGYWHQAHSFVRGNWRNEAESSPMLLAKCCHDLDWIRHIMGVPCRAVQSFGSLRHFHAGKKPVDAGTRCLDCPVEPECPFSARKIYIDRLEQGVTGWPNDVLTPNVNKENLTQALEEGPYGRCVYDCDNDVVDNQVVNMQFDGGSTASLTMTAFTQATDRRIRIFGTRGELEGDGSKIKLFDFLSDTWSDGWPQGDRASASGGHGGGDEALTNAFIEAVAGDDPSRILSGPEESLESHRMVFCAEESRCENSVVKL